MRIVGGRWAGRDSLRRAHFIRSLRVNSGANLRSFHSVSYAVIKKTHPQTEDG